ncbi:MBOAT family protein [Paenibacillus sp. N3.4]|uniref:MBOAT family O-acyltransferase n=1 Tax=Paenibacillus sp. N3.4 TaxID=2603222 RepID=UPI0011C901FB|nr:MBOAT family O-acyltransferase [Paenibacillus sp. N3.4]TXK71735.1 MBOAT family protein [Paenibacillus sp. N3.4]
MMFNTPEFACLLLLSMILFYIFPKWRLLLLTIANVLFYAIVGIGYLFLFGAVSSIAFLCAKRLQGSKKSLFLWLGIIVSVGNLVFFKYMDFLFRAIERFFSISLVTHDAKWLHLVLPLGISFYTFELIAYLVDVYKQKIKPETSILRFWMFIMFFAHMIAGPIMRGKEFLPQIQGLSSIRFQMSNMRMGVFLLSLGLIKKVFISDNLAPYCDDFFAHPEWLDGAEGWTASILYAFQIYFDFSGYSDMAVGIGCLFGLKLAANFSTPYLSTNPTEFWTRWHITLSSWIKDYVYITLGGSRSGKFRQYANLFIAMTISGFWHGNQWTFVAWGMYQGGLLVGHKLWMFLFGKAGLQGLYRHWWYKLVSIVSFFGLTCIGWVLFRAESLHAALSLIKRMLKFPEAFNFPQWVQPFWLIIAGLILLHILEYLLIKNINRVSTEWHRLLPAPLRAQSTPYSWLFLFCYIKASKIRLSTFSFRSAHVKPFPK